jgi:Co/Zn/Cd efflux system component
MTKEILIKSQPSNTSESSCTSASRPSNEYVLVSGGFQRLFLIAILVELHLERYKYRVSNSARSWVRIYFIIFYSSYTPQNVAFLSFLLFTLLQFVFAWAAGSQAMMADCAAMSVDVLTYLFNFFAERIKHSELSPDMPAADGIRHRELRRLYLELFPPLLSVTTLLVVTIVATYQAAITIMADDKNLGDQPDVVIMLVFSGLNLILDMVNVTCFARAGQAEYLPSSIVSSMESPHHHHPHQSCNHAHDDPFETPTETSRLVGKGTTNHGSNDHDEESPHHEINLNMCSAWTVSCFVRMKMIRFVWPNGIDTGRGHVKPNQCVTGCLTLSLLLWGNGISEQTYHVTTNN